MIYAKVGPAWIETEGFQGFGATFKQTLPAVQGGLGIETLIAPNIALRAEATYTYATSQLSLNSGSDVYRPSFLMVDLGLAYKFDAPAGWGVPGTAPASTRPGMAYKAAQAPLAAPFTPTWTGFEIGGFISANGSQMILEDSLLSETGPYTSFNIGGGWLAGANYQIQRFVIGIEASGNYEAAKFWKATGSGGLAMNFYRFAKIEGTYALTARAGWLVTPSTLFYVKGGPSEIRVTPDSLFFNAVAANVTPTRSLFGYQAGGGAETFVTSNVSVRAEGLYTYTPDTIILNGAVPNQIKLKPYVLSGTVGAALHF
jgi:opacity protein-like surface antigen